MANQYWEGFGMGDMLFWNSHSASNAVVTTNPRTGSDIYSVLLAGASSECVKSNTAVSEGHWGFAFRPGAGTDTFARFRNSTTIHIELRLNLATRFIEIYRSSTLIATGSIAMQTGAWRFVSVYVKVSDTVGECTVRVDGTTDATFSGDTRNGATTTIDNLSVNSAGNQFTDIAMNDTTGIVDNSWVADFHTKSLVVNGNGDVSQLTGSDGNSVDNYLHVDETPSDDDTTYVQGSVVDERDLYAVTDSGLSGITITDFRVESRSRDTVGAGGLISLGVKTHATEYWGTDRALATSYGAVYGDDLKTNPFTGSAMTISELDAIQIGVKTRS